MLRKSTILSVFILFAILLAGCAENRTARSELESSRERVAEFPVARVYTKAVSDAMGKTVYAYVRSSQEIDIFVDGQRVNSLGGLGFERGNFQRLSDIGVDADGGLLALDSARKLLRKFSSEGMFISEFSLKTLNQPELFCVAPDGTLFVYDAAPSEIICYSPLDGREFNSFGRFELDQPQNLDCNKDYLWAQNRDRESTQVFSLLGQLEYSAKVFRALDRVGNMISYGRVEGVSNILQSPLSLTVQGDLVTVLWENEIWMDRLVYGRRGGETQ